jgi:hypothetical protein
MDLDFDDSSVLERAKGNASAFFHVSLRWAREQGNEPADAWASFVGQQFASSWDEMASDASAVDVARQAARNYATTADMRPLHLSGDASRAEIVLEGPDQDWLDMYGSTREQVDRANELIYAPIAKRLGLSLERRRDGTGLHLTFARRP